ncbi:multicopper oxidase family protein [Candidatus Marithrix sp. Canyon 246]|uniref:multicopper oxidase family protein n=1 Tax=Candidatus Marithrix sp. Canyon 246 TaxID=1827136 RepID=UPI000849EE58|nr:multicopper oxidase domain-containing protein [Candidatus Marithrix sp. Canyon 246]
MSKILILLLLVFNPLVLQANWQLDIGISGDSPKKLNEDLNLQLNIQVTNSQNADIYLALQLPDTKLLFLQTQNNLTTKVAAYASKQAPNNTAFNITTQLPQDSQAGKYNIYAVATKIGVDVFDQSQWLSPLAHKGFFFINNSFPIPPLLTGSLNDKGQKVFNLNLQQAEKSFLPGTKTATLGINGDYLGPTIRVSNGDNVLFNIHNTIGETTTIHWHGAHVPPKMDGGPHQKIKNNATWRPFFEIKQLAATIWYHSHLKGKTAEHVYKGLAGMFIIDDAVSDKLALPRNYGVDDIPVVVQDRRIAANGEMTSQIRNEIDMMGLRGEYILVNGAITPTLNTRAQVIRLRLLNGSNARIYNFGFADNREFYQIASGGGLLEAPVTMQRLRLSSGERAEILLDLRADSGKSLLLKSYSAEITPMTITNSMMRDTLDMQTFDVMSIRVGETGDNGLSIPTKLTTIERLRPEDAVVTRSFMLKVRGMMGGGGGGMGMNGLIAANNAETFENLSNRKMFTINDKVMDMNRIDETVRLGDTEIWTIRNNNVMAHPFHIHDIQFQILDRDGQAPSAGEAGWKDTVLVLPHETVRVISRFEDFADPDIPYMYHCHILEHEDAGMMGQFLVIK